MNVIKIREFLHKIPELGFEEYKTKKFILEYAKNYSCRVIEFSSTGVIISFNDKKRKTICFRAEEDALEIEEENDIAYRSIHKNKMHACGHDGHMAILLKLGDFISSNLKRINYNVLLIFQPSEERYGGSKSLIDSKILDKRNILAFYSLHIWPRLSKGKIITSFFPFLSKSIEFDISIYDECKHIGDLEENKSFNALSYILWKINILDKKMTTKKHKIGIGKIEGGKVRNVSPDKITIQGSIRVFSEEDAKYILEEFKKIIVEASFTYSMFIDLSYNDDFYLVKNDESLLNKIKDEVEIQDLTFYQSEDFGLYSKYYPTVFFLLGGGDIPSLHQSTFNFDPNILNVGLELYKKLLFKKY